MRTITRTCLALALIFGVGLSAVACNYGVPESTPTSPTTSTTTTTGGSTPTPPTTPSTGLTYVKDVQPLLASDCFRCHGPTRRDAGYDFSTYAGVMKAVTAGSANSKLVKATQQGGIMFGEWLGNNSAKAALIREWVVTWKAQQQ